MAETVLVVDPDVTHRMVTAELLSTAGYQTVPEDVQEACSQWVAKLYFLTNRDPGLTRQAIVNSGSYEVEQLAGHPPAGVAVLLAPHRRHHVYTSQG